ncbi:DUF3105 domain-containing protein [Mycolicibacterium wolinskyi]|nr:DUF3105 domain-containing protein [Mycolicibacterium wolinskyi]
MTTGRPWGSVAAVAAVVVFAGAVFGYIYVRSGDQRERQAALAPFAPSAANQDPSLQIPGIVVKSYRGADHVAPTQRVAYDGNPPYGGPHDAAWAACDGVVYSVPIRAENAVHSLEHGAVWIAYHPDKIVGTDLEGLRGRARGNNYVFMSPVPTMNSPVSLQSWGHQLTLDDANDERIDQFISALRTNRFTHPEVGATCAPLGPGRFDPANPPPFDPTPHGPDAVPVDGAK